MYQCWVALILMSVLTTGMCDTLSRHIARKEIPRGFYSKRIHTPTGQGRFSFIKRTDVSPMKRVADEVPKHGSFKIDDGKVIGGGIYEINEHGLSLDIKLKIAPDFEESKEKPQTTAAPPTEAPGGSETTTAPGGSETTAAPGGAETTTAPGGSETTAAPSEETTPAAEEEGSDVEKEALEMHNKFRKIHGVPPMKLNAKMSESAAKYAAKIANMGSLMHSSREERNGEGENLSMGCSSNNPQTATQAVTNWYNEVCEPGYQFGVESGGGGAGHFTQVVWKESVELGFGLAEVNKNGMKCSYSVGRYKIAGNMMGEYANNVLKGNFDQSYCKTIKKDR